MNNYDWDAIRVFLAVAEHRSLSGAARELALSQPTVGRQISKLESQLGLQLFDRRQTGFVVTDEGGRLVEAAQAMARGAADIKRSVDLEKSHAPDQVCRIALGEWGLYFLSSRAAEIVDGLEGVRLEFYADDAFWDLTRNAADIAIGNRPPKQGHLIAAKLGERGFHVYASSAYCDLHPNAGEPETWADQTWVMYCGSRARLRSAQALAGILDDRTCRYAVNSSVALLGTVKAGNAMGVLPDWIGEDEGLIRLSSEPLATNTAWLSFHERLKLHRKLAEVKNRISNLYKRRYLETDEALRRSSG